MPFKGLVQLSLKNAQHENCELHFIWGKMKTLAQETAFQIALRNCSQEVRGKGQYICDFGKGGVHEIKHVYLKKVSASLLEVIASHEEQMSP